MAVVALNLTKVAVSLEGEGFRRIRKLQIFINCQKKTTDWCSQLAVKRYIAGGRLGTYNYYNPRAHAPSVNYCNPHAHAQII